MACLASLHESGVGPTLPERPLFHEAIADGNAFYFRWLRLIFRGADVAAKPTARELTKRRNRARTAAGKLAEASARVAQAEAELALIANLDAPTIAVLTANIEQARQSLHRAEVDLDLLTVRAPVDATMLQVNVRAGEFAQAGNVTPALMVLGNQGVIPS